MAIATEEPTTTLIPLPDPDLRPLADVVIYDGHCRMCLAQITFLERWFAAGRLAYLSLHDVRVAVRYPELSPDDMMRQMYVVDRRGRQYGGAMAVRYLSRRLPRLWWLAPLLYLPGTMPLWQWLYRQVANRRYLFGRLDECAGGSCSLHR